MRQNRLYIILFLCSLWLALPLSHLSAQGKDFTLVIDPGHGGKDPGAIGKKGKEKNINLSVALKLGNLIKENCKDVNIVYTRQKDTFVALDRRAQIANNAKADLFISIHTNSVAKGKTVRGTETYTLGLHRTEDNLEVAKKENSVILIESDYEQRYAGFNPNSAESYIIFEFLQDKNMEKSVRLATDIQKQFRNTAKRIDKGVHQAGFLVLRETTMPGVLVELGYISNPDEERYLLTEAGTSALAKSIYQAFLSYKKKFDMGDTTRPALAKTPEKVQEPAPAQKPKTQSKPQTPNKPKNEPTKSTQSDKPIFKIQFLTSDKKLPAGSKLFKGLTPVGHYQEKGIYKYTYGESHDYNKVLRTKRQISTKFKDAFIIAFKNGKKMNVNEAIKEFKNNR
jgi:N-acetylmuramoyl-L-alanine amidase